MNVIQQQMCKKLWGHSFSTYAQRGEWGSSKSVRHAYKGGGGLHVEVRTQKRPFFARVL